MGVWGKLSNSWGPLWKGLPRSGPVGLRMNGQQNAACIDMFRAMSTVANPQDSGAVSLSKTLVDKSDESRKNKNRILHTCQERLAEVLSPLNQKVFGPLEKDVSIISPMPFVFLLGNHSSGKSSFINFVLKKKIQTTGVAPTDDSFTIIAPGTKDVDQHGPALVGDHQLGFTGLRQFGPNLINHTTLKVREGLETDFLIIDSPGMIDSPNKHRHLTPVPLNGNNTEQGREVSFDRGYDFQGVTRWFAERADVILLFFDPDKPGTTGETLDILIHSLAGLDHKLHIVMNKVDQFTRIHDFARAYGSLCWNLSKVIPRKDLPRIYTMFIPGHLLQSMDENALRSPLADLEQSRRELVNEVHLAPERRVHNMITRLHDSAFLLQMYIKVLDSIRVQHRNERWRHVAIAAASAILGTGITATTVVAAAPWEASLGISLFSALAIGAAYWNGKRSCSILATHLKSSEGIQEHFAKHYRKDVEDVDEYIQSMWNVVRPQLQTVLKMTPMKELPAVSGVEADKIRAILDEDVPALRKEASSDRVITKKSSNL